jgi:hypothetical protein
MTDPSKIIAGTFPPPPMPPPLPFINGILNRDQSNYHNYTPSFTSNIPTLVIAILSNVPQTTPINCEPDVIVELVSKTVSFQDFIYTFYGNSAYVFGVNPVNATRSIASLLGQKYSTTPNSDAIFFIVEQFIKAWTNKNNKPPSALSPVALMNLQKESFLFNSLANLIFMKALAFDQALALLISSGQIQPIKSVNGVKTSATNEYRPGVPVNFVIDANVYSTSLDSVLGIKIPFIVNLPGYELGPVYSTYLPDTVVPPIMSNMQKLSIERPYLDDDDDNYTLKSEDLSEFKKQNTNNYEYSIDNVPKQNANIDEEKTVFSEISKIVNKNTDDDNSIGQGSVGNGSKW